MFPIDFWVKRSSWFLEMASLGQMNPEHNCFLFTSIVMKLNTQTPHELGVCPIDFEVKSQSHKALITEKHLWQVITFPLHLSSSNFKYRHPIWFWDQGQGHDVLIKKSCLWCIFAFCVYLLSWNFTHTESRMCHIDFKVKVTMHW